METLRLSHSLKQAYLIRKQCHCSLERNSCNSGNARATKVKSQVPYICIYTYPQFFTDTPDSTLLAPICQLVSIQQLYLCMTTQYSVDVVAIK